MAVVEVDISMSVDGFVTGPDLDEDPGLGVTGRVLHDWLGEPAGKRIIDGSLGASGSVVTSRRVYDLTGGWGDTGFYNVPVYVLTHHAHEVVVKGETTFTFVTDGIESAVAQAVAAAGEDRVHIMGGGTVIQQALAAGLVDELHLHVAHVLLGAGTPLFAHLGAPIPLARISVVETPDATHLRYRIQK
jgi:dihydrofolate reductase